MSGVNYIDIAQAIKEPFSEQKYFIFPFYKNSLPLEKGKRWGMTLFASGSMRFRWNEKNENRQTLLHSIIRKEYHLACTGSCSSEKEICDCKPKIVPLELIHSKKVCEVKKEGETKNCQGDGLVTKNPLLMPVITVADCVPIFFYDSVTGAFGVVHSGWKGTGIIASAIELAVEKYGSKIEDICVAIGPHIQSECYCIDKERRDFFEERFGNCTSEVLSTAPLKNLDGKDLTYNLSLTKANLNILKQIGIEDSNIAVANECTACSKFSDGKYIFGSFRREVAFLPEAMSTEEKSKKMTVQAAFVL